MPAGPTPEEQSQQDESRRAILASLVAQLEHLPRGSMVVINESGNYQLITAPPDQPPSYNRSLIEALEDIGPDIAKNIIEPLRLCYVNMPAGPTLEEQAALDMQAVAHINPIVSHMPREARHWNVDYVVYLRWFIPMRQGENQEDSCVPECR